MIALPILLADSKRVNRISIALGASLGLVTVANAELMTSISPLNSIVAAIRGEVASQIVPSNVSPHDFQLRPSAARQLQKAELLIWGGAQLEPDLAPVIENLAQVVSKLEVQSIDGVTLYHYRGKFGHTDDHGHDHQHGDDEALDAHYWLDLGNIERIASALVAAFSAQAPEQAAQYQANADAFMAKFESFEQLNPSIRYAVSHDALQFFERSNGLAEPLMVISQDAELGLGASAVAELSAHVDELDCLLAEGGRGADWAALGLALPVIEIDPAGLSLDGVEMPDFLPTLYNQIGRAFEQCGGQINSASE